MGPVAQPSISERDLSRGSNVQNVETANNAAPINETPISADLSQARESTTSNSGNNTPRTEEPVSQSLRGQKILINRVIYFSLFAAFCAPIANFFLTYKMMNMGITLNLMIWVLFGIVWCLGFTMVMGPFFALVGTFVRFLDVIPALGSSLWTLLSIGLSIAIINDSMVIPPINNLPLFSLIFANGIATLAILQHELPETDIHTRATADTGNEYHKLSVAVGYVFRNGKCEFHDIGTNSPSSKFDLPFTSLPETFAQAYQQIRNKSSKYLQGADLIDFDSDFEIWQREARRLQRSLWLRRLLCLVGYVIEIAALYFSFVFLNQLRGFTGKNDKQATPEPINFLLPIWQIVLVVIISCFSDYLWTFLNIESTCTSPPEVSSMMLQRLSSSANWSGPQSGYLTNGKWLRSPWSAKRYGEIQAGELPTIGIVLGDNGLETGLTILHSTIPNCRLTVKRINSELLRAQLLLEDESERLRLEGGSVTISEMDKVI